MEKGSQQPWIFGCKVNEGHFAELSITNGFSLRIVSPTSKTYSLFLSEHKIIPYSHGLILPLASFYFFALIFP